MKKSIPTTEDVLALAEGFLFEGAPEAAEAAARDPGFGLYVFRRGDRICSEDDDRRGLWLVLSGSVLAEKERDKRESFVMRRIPAGGAFGAASLFGGGGFVSDVRAAEDCRVAFLQPELAERLMRESFRVAENYIRFLSSRVRYLNRRIEGFVSGGSSELLLHYLESAGGGEPVTLDCSFTELAARLGIGRASLYRALDALETSGALRREGKTIYINTP